MHSFIDIIEDITSSLNQNYINMFNGHIPMYFISIHSKSYFSIQKMTSISWYSHSFSSMEADVVSKMCYTTPQEAIKSTFSALCHMVKFVHKMKKITSDDYERIMDKIKNNAEFKDVLESI